MLVKFSHTAKHYLSRPNGAQNVFTFEYYLHLYLQYLGISQSTD